MNVSNFNLHIHECYIYIFISLLYNFSDVLVSEMILVGIAVEVCISLI